MLILGLFLFKTTIKAINRLKLNELPPTKFRFGIPLSNKSRLTNIVETVFMSAWIYIGSAVGIFIICLLAGCSVRKHAEAEERTRHDSLPWILLLYSAFSIVSMCCALTYGNKTDKDENSAPSIEAELLAKFSSLKNLLVQTAPEDTQVCHNGCGLNPEEWQSTALIPKPRQPILSDLNTLTHQSHSILPFSFNTQVAAHLSRRELHSHSESISLSL